MTIPPLFANVLMDAMIGAGYISCSELARRAFGTIKDDRGYDVARNRDRVGAYLKGTSYPTPANLQKIAGALGVPVAELAWARRPPSRRQRHGKPTNPAHPDVWRFTM